MPHSRTLSLVDIEFGTRNVVPPLFEGCPVSITKWARLPAPSAGTKFLPHVHPSRGERVQLIIHVCVSGVRYLLSFCI